VTNHSAIDLPYRLVDVAADSDVFRAVFKLGESQSRYVGMLTPAAWRQYADNGTILAAVGEADVLLGYVAFRLPRNDVVVAHLVVAPHAQHRGVARLLVDELSRRYNHRRGLSARCRRDWPANDMWPRLGFVPRGERPGRSLKGHLLTDWWRDHGHHDLLSWDGPRATTVPVICDANVFIDLHGTNAGEAAVQVRYLLKEVLGDRIELLVTPELRNELNRNNNLAVRTRMLRTADLYPHLSVSHASLEQAREALVDMLGREPDGARNRSDLMQVAWAAAAHVPAMVTRDNPAMRRLSQAAGSVGVRLVSPEEVVVLVDEIESAPSYTPSALLNTGYEVVEAGIGDRSALDLFFHTGSGEKKKDFQGRLRHLASERGAGAHRRLYRAPVIGDEAVGEPVALVGCAANAGVLEVTLLRLRECALQATLAAQVVAGLRTLAVEAGVSGIVMSDPHTHPSMFDALIADGFRAAGDALVAVAVPGCTTMKLLTQKLADAAESLAQRSEVFADVLTPNRDVHESASGALNVERQLRPLRVVDAPVPCWLVPIKPAFSSQLFGYPEELFPRQDSLGISIEHVYYRGGKSGESAPGRILWYVSGAMEVIAVSDLVEVADGDPIELWRRFRRLGVYDRGQVVAAANKVSGKVRALRVVNTQPFPYRIGLRTLRGLAERNRQTLRLRSSSQVSTGLCADVMREGLGG
jgi:ribosomal protein S18 acetylase RimI-like enzyme